MSCTTGCDGSRTMLPTPKAILFSTCNFIDYPQGGALSFAKHLIKAFGSRFALVGVTTDDTPVGEWVLKEIEGLPFLFFSIEKRDDTSSGRPLVPLGARSYLALMRHKKAILSLGIRNAFAACGLSLAAIRNWPWDALGGCMHGIRNPFDKPRYWYGKTLGPLWSTLRQSAINRASVVLIPAAITEIDEFIAQAKGRVNGRHLVHFPTRVDTDIFRPMLKSAVRKQLCWDKEALVLATCGRISWVKGWDLILDAFSRLLARHEKAMLVYVGDGEDRPKLESEIRRRGLSGHVVITGFCASEKVAAYLNAADVFVMGSHWEGWPTAMVEALACGKPIVSTNIHAAAALVVEGQNGYVIRRRDDVAFAEAIERAAELVSAREISLRLAERYALRYLARDFARLWPVLLD
jgi:glycosyltransferase involved in cell wall biosynthesis